MCPGSISASERKRKDGRHRTHWEHVKNLKYEIYGSVFLGWGSDVVAQRKGKDD
jgi:hypothetical protein